MSVSEETPIAQSVANGVTTSFPHSFTVQLADDLVVTGWTEGDATPTPYVYGVDYTLTGLGTNTGSVEFIAPPPDGTVVTRYRDIAATRGVDYQENGDLLSGVLNSDIDRLWFAMQDRILALLSSIRAPIGETISELPVAAARALKTLTFDADGKPSATTPAAGTVGAFGADLLDNSQSTNGVGMVGHSQALPYGLGTAGAHLNRTISADGAPYAAVGDGVVNDTAAIIAADLRAAALGATLVLDGTKTYAVSQITFTAKEVRTNGATFKVIDGTSEDSPAVIIDAGTKRVDSVVIYSAAGFTTRKRLVLCRNLVNAHIGRIIVKSDVQVTIADNLDAAVRISNCDDTTIDYIEVRKFDFAIRVQDANVNLTVGKVLVESYICGLNIRQGVGMSFGGNGGMFITTRSPNWTVVAPGQNGILVGNDGGANFATANVKFIDPYIRDSGEHGIRCAGEHHTADIHIIRPNIKDTGGSSIKFLTGADGVYCYRPRIISPVLANARKLGIKLSCGVVFYRVVDGLIDAPMITAEDGYSYCGEHGISIYDVSGVAIRNPVIKSAQFNGISIRQTHGTGDEDSPSPVYRDSNQVSISGGHILLCGADGIDIPTEGLTHRRFRVDGTLLESNTGYGVDINSTGAPSAGSVDWGYFATIGRANTAGHMNVGGSVGNTGRISVALIGQYTAGLVCANGSTQQDTDNGSFYIRKAGVWTAM